MVLHLEWMYDRNCINSLFCFFYITDCHINPNIFQHVRQLPKHFINTF